MEVVQVKTGSRIEFVDITSKISEAIAKSGVKEGIAVVYVPHTTAALTINEAADPSVAQDISAKLSQLAPHLGGYRHHEGNSDAHIKSALVGCSVNLIVSGGAPILGTWQGIFFCEFDGPRTRKVHVQVCPA